jgi:hypothetical protein
LSGIANLLIGFGLLLIFGEAHQTLHDRVALTAVYWGLPWEFDDQPPAASAKNNLNQPQGPNTKAIDQLIFK